MNIVICPRCKSKYIKNIKKYDKIYYHCLNCKRVFNDNTKELRELLDNDYTIYDENSSKDEKEKLFNFLFKDKMKFMNRKDMDKSLQRWLDINYIKIKNIDITVEKVFNYLKNLTDKDFKCKNNDCDNKTKFIGIWDKYPNGHSIFCSDKCFREYFSQLQMGNNNTSHRMSDETRKRISINQSLLMKDKIRKGEFTPNITNSWSNSKCKLNVDDTIKYFRSTWEAFFNLVNPSLLYENLRINYTYNNEKHNYVVDFIDTKNKIIYEIKPDSERYKLKNEIKRQAAIKWCTDNKYSYHEINNNWFKENYNKYKYLIIGQPDELKMIKNLKQFDNENKEN